MKMQATAADRGEVYLSLSFLRKLDKAEPYVRELIISLAEEIQSKIIVSRTDFDDLKNIVRELAEAQKETKNELKALAEAQKNSASRTDFDDLKNIVRELAEAQKETKNELKALAEAQKNSASRTDLDDLKNIVRELVEAQKNSASRTDLDDLKNIVRELAEAQKRTELSMEELVKAQKKTEAEVRDMKKQLGGLTADVGYGIEDKIMPCIFDFGKKEFDADIRLVERKNLVYPDGKYDEINIYAEGLKNGKQVFIIGECKAQPGKKDFDRFAKIAERVKKILSGDIYAFIVGYSFSPEVEIYAEEKYPYIRTYKSYQFEMKYKKIS